MPRKKQMSANVGIELDDIMAILFDGQKVLEKCSNMINESRKLDASNDSEFAKTRTEAVDALANFVSSTTVVMTKLSEKLNAAVAENETKLQEKQNDAQNVE